MRRTSRSGFQPAQRNCCPHGLVVTGAEARRDRFPRRRGSQVIPYHLLCQPELEYEGLRQKCRAMPQTAHHQPDGRIGLVDRPLCVKGGTVACRRVLPRQRQGGPHRGVATGGGVPGVMTSGCSEVAGRETGWIGFFYPVSSGTAGRAQVGTLQHLDRTRRAAEIAHLRGKDRRTAGATSHRFANRYV